MEIPIILVGVNGRYKKKLKGQFMCQTGQHTRYESMAKEQYAKSAY